jgi:predicted nucleic acid-binding protein
VALKTVLDTNAILYILGGRVAESLPAEEHFVSVISEMELLSYPLLDASAQTKIREFLSDVTVAGLTEEVKDHAIRLRLRHQLKLPDAIVAATALSLEALLVTNDARLLRIPEVQSRSLKLKDVIREQA